MFPGQDIKRQLKLANIWSVLLRSERTLSPSKGIKRRRTINSRSHHAVVVAVHAVASHYIRIGGVRLEYRYRRSRGTLELLLRPIASITAWATHVYLLKCYLEFLRSKTNYFCSNDEKNASCSRPGGMLTCIRDKRRPWTATSAPLMGVGAASPHRQQTRGSRRALRCRARCCNLAAVCQACAPGERLSVAVAEALAVPQACSGRCSSWS